MVGRTGASLGGNSEVPSLMGTKPLRACADHGQGRTDIVGGEPLGSGVDRQMDSQQAVWESG